MRKSSSVSHIPIKSESRTRSTSTVRTSTKETGVHSHRTSSTDRLSLKRSMSLLSIKRTTPRTTPVSSVSKGLRPSNTRVRSNSLATPLSSRGRSPFKSSLKKERPLDDKKWVSEQFAKVRNFLQEHPYCEPHIADRMKPPTINTFVYIAGLLLKEIDARIDINTVNYKEVILKQTKVLIFPGNISNSVLKTVNAMHAWPQVINLFSWLIDLIIQLRKAQLPTTLPLKDVPQFQVGEAITDCLCQRYVYFNNNEDVAQADERFRQKFSEILKIDHSLVERLTKETSELKLRNENQAEMLSEKVKRNKILADELEKMQNEIDTFYTEDALNEEQINKEINDLTTYNEKISNALKQVTTSISKLREALKVQSCSYNEKKTILIHIDEMKHTIKLKREKIESWRQIRDNCDLNLADIRKTVESEVYRLNSALMPLILLHPELKILKLRDKGLHLPDFYDEITNVTKMLESLVEHINSEINEVATNITINDKDQDGIKRGTEVVSLYIEKLEAEIKELELKIEACNKTTERNIQESEENRKVLLIKLEDLTKNVLNNNALKMNLKELRDKKVGMIKEVDEIQTRCLHFFLKIHDMTMSSLMDMDKIRVNVMTILSIGLGNVFQTESAILQDLLNKLDCLK